MMFSQLVLAGCLALCIQGEQEKQDKKTKFDIPKFDEWVDHKWGNLKVKLPFKPALQKKTIKHEVLGQIEISIFVCEISNNAALLVSELTYPVEPDQYDVKAGLKGAVEGMVRNAKGKLEEETDIKLNGIPGKEATVTISNLIAKARIYIDQDGPTLYQFQAIGNKQFLETDAVKKFFSSANVLPIKMKP